MLVRFKISCLTVYATWNNVLGKNLRHKGKCRKEKIRRKFTVGKSIKGNSSEMKNV